MFQNSIYAVFLTVITFSLYPEVSTSKEILRSSQNPLAALYRIDQSVTRVHPKFINGQNVLSQHYPLTGKELGQ